MIQNAQQLLETLKEGDTVQIDGPVTTRDLILECARFTGFEDEPHILGEPSALADLLGEQLAFMCAAGTNIVLHIALAKLFYEKWELARDIEKMEVKCELTFHESNPEGGKLNTTFTVAGKRTGKFPTKVPGVTKPSTIVSLGVVMTNTRAGKVRKVATGSLLLQFV